MTSSIEKKASCGPTERPKDVFPLSFALFGFPSYLLASMTFSISEDVNVCCRV